MNNRRRSGAAIVVLAALALFMTACDPARVYHYRIATRGPVVADMSEFAGSVAQTLNDPRGWSLGGSVRFEQTAGPGDFTVWLSTAGNLPSFSSACSSQWSCRSGPNVVINQDRWLGATATWPYGLESYRHYVVNHETGHWLGLGHSSCGGFGQRAPVMVQQSKGGAPLGSCVFNVWPVPGELGAVGSSHGVPVWPSGLPSPDDPFGKLEAVTVTRDGQGKPVHVELSGWAIDGDTTNPLTVLMSVDNVVVAQASSDLPRPDLAAAFPRYGDKHAFKLGVDVPTTAQTSCVVAVGTQSGVARQQIGCGVVK